MDLQTVELFRKLNPQNQLDIEPGKLIIGAHSPETAVAVSNYPYGRRLRCIMRYWLEYKRGHGTRLVAQTNNPNPKRPGLVWNKPHAETYINGAVVLVTNEEGHVKHLALSTWDFAGAKSVPDCEAKIAKVQAFFDANCEALTDHDRDFIAMIKESLARRIGQLSTPHPRTAERTTCNVCKNYQTDCTGTSEQTYVSFTQDGQKYSASRETGEIQELTDEGDDSDDPLSPFNGESERLSRLADPSRLGLV